MLCIARSYLMFKDALWTILRETPIQDNGGKCTAMYKAEENAKLISLKLIKLGYGRLNRNSKKVKRSPAMNWKI